MRTNVESLSDSMDVHVIYHVTCILGQKEATSKWPDVVMTVSNGVYVTKARSAHYQESTRQATYM